MATGREEFLRCMAKYHHHIRRKRGVTDPDIRRRVVALARRWHTKAVRALINAQPGTGEEHGNVVVRGPWRRVA